MQQKLRITAKPEREDFFGKYEKSGKIGQILLDNYFQQVELLTSRALKSRKVHRALEIGCGPGYSTQRISKMLPNSAKLDASEYVPSLVEIAKKNNPKINIWQENAYQLKSRENTYDLIYFLEVLEHLDHPKVALSEIKRVLKPGGFLILGVPREPLWRILNMARGSYLNRLGNTPGHLNHWSSSSLRSFIEKNFGKAVDKRTPLPWSIILSKVTKS